MEEKTFFSIRLCTQKIKSNKKKHTVEPQKQYSKSSGQIMLTRKKIGGLDGLDVEYRQTFSMIIKPFLKNGSKKSSRIFNMIYSSF